MAGSLLLVLTVSLSLLSFAKPQTINSCPSEDALIERFNQASHSLEVRGCSGQTCHMEDHHDDHHDDHDDHDHDHDDDHHEDENMNCTSCENIFSLTRRVILALNLTTTECLEAHAHNETPTTTTSSEPSSAEAYGYGFLMIVLVCLCSLVGVFLVPLINSESKIGQQTYEYMYAFMIAIAISALICDAVLHLIPHSFGLHGHEEEGAATGADDGHGHGHGSTTTTGEEESHNIDYIWKGCLVLLGVYLFYLLEVALHGLGDYLKKSNSRGHGDKYGCQSGDSHYSSTLPEMKEVNKEDEEAKLTRKDEEAAVEEDGNAKVKGKFSFLKKVEPVAWLIIFGDALHNFADGIALGAAIVQSLTLGVSIMFALIFHEVPHELGDYVILIKAGFHWGVALLFNFFSSLTAILGFFIGAAISSNSEEANGWILAITAGLFLYIALTDLLPELIHGGTYVKLTKTGWRWGLRFFLANLGFFISFALLLVLAIYEEDLNELIE